VWGDSKDSRNGPRMLDVQSKYRGNPGDQIRGPTGVLDLVGSAVGMGLNRPHDEMGEHTDFLLPMHCCLRRLRPGILRLCSGKAPMIFTLESWAWCFNPGRCL
jgi:hypothetical protein